MTNTSRLQANVVRTCFGAALSDIGRGFSVTLELLAILRGTLDLPEADGPGILRVPAPGEPVRYMRRSHDFARRMPSQPDDLLRPEELEALEGEDTRATLAALVDALTVPFPGRRAKQTFKQRLLYPYVGELIHYDAVDRRGRGVSLEQHTFRGGGGLAYKMLGRDDDAARLEANESGLLELISDSGSALGRLAAAMQAHDVVPAPDTPPFVDERAAAAEPMPGGARWSEALCDGVSNIVGRRSLTRAKRVEMLMHWVPYCVARYQLDVATSVLGRPAIEIPIDLRFGANTIRRASQEVLQKVPTTIGQALAATAHQLAEADEVDADDAIAYREIADTALGAKSSMKSARAFFPSTMWTVGALNAPSGTRHFTLRLPLLEAIVGAGIRPDEEMPFTDFCRDVLFGRFGLLVDQGAARRSAIGDAIDTAEFDENGEILARKLTTLGLLTEYSDATRMVHAEVRR
jgi:hypothetical protein